MTRAPLDRLVWFRSGSGWGGSECGSGVVPPLFYAGSGHLTDRVVPRAPYVVGAPGTGGVRS